MILARFALYLGAGFIEMWLLLWMWGMTAGPVDAIPYFALIGCLVLVLVAAPLTVLADRIAALVAIPGSVLASVWLVAALREGSLGGAVLFGTLPLTAIIVSAKLLWSSRGASWLRAPAAPPLKARIGIAVVPLVMFAATFNGRLVAQLVLAGPTK